MGTQKNCLLVLVRIIKKFLKQKKSLYLGRPLDKCVLFTLVLPNQDLSFFENTADPDQPVSYDDISRVMNSGTSSKQSQQNNVATTHPASMLDRKKQHKRLVSVSFINLYSLFSDLWKNLTMQLCVDMI